MAHAQLRLLTLHAQGRGSKRGAMMTSDRALEHISKYYGEKLRNHGATAAGADWRDQTSQELRFSELVKITEGATAGQLVEIGCGWGAFPQWAVRRGCTFKYTGYDISKEMIQAAKETCKDLPDVDFRWGSSQFQSADWVIASGIFNVRLDTSDAEWRDHVDATIDEMALASRQGFAFNCLSGFSDPHRKAQYLYYPYPGEMLDAVMRRYGRHVALLHNTKLYEFTILVWRSI
jgi:Methyltransferase domain